MKETFNVHKIRLQNWVKQRVKTDSVKLIIQ